MYILSLNPEKCEAKKRLNLISEAANLINDENAVDLKAIVNVDITDPELTDESEVANLNPNPVTEDAEDVLTTKTINTRPPGSNQGIV